MAARANVVSLPTERNSHPERQLREVPRANQPQPGTEEGASVRSEKEAFLLASSVAARAFRNPADFFNAQAALQETESVMALLGEGNARAGSIIA